MGKKQTTYANEFKFKVIKEVLREELPILQIANKHGVTPKNIYNWKSTFEKKGADVFSLNDPNLTAYKVLLAQHEQKIDELHRQLGELNAQLTWAKKKSTGTAHVNA
jgi:transposase-like protein